MDVPVLPGLSLVTSKNKPIAPVVANEASSANEGKFSDHLDENVGRLVNNKKQQEADRSAVKGVAEPSNKEVASTDKVELDASIESSVRLDQAQLLAQDLQNLLVKETVPELAEGGTAINVLTNKQVSAEIIDVSTESGNELPLAEADIDSLSLMGGLPLAIEISFDPLTQANESSAHMAALVTSGVVEQKTQPSAINHRVDPLVTSVLDAAPGLQNVLDTAVSHRVDPLVTSLLDADSDLQNSAILLGKAVETIKAGNAVPVPANAALSTDGVVNTLATQAQLLASGGGEKATVPLETPMGHPRWGQDFNQRVQWMVNQSVSGAQIRLNPQHMGPVEVRIQLHNDQMSISFTAQHGATREAIDAALPRLREMLSDQNVNIVDVDVSQNSFAEQRDKQASANENNVTSGDSAEQEESIFDKSENEVERTYIGLFSGFA